MNKEYPEDVLRAAKALWVKCVPTMSGVDEAFKDYLEGELSPGSIIGGAIKSYLEDAETVLANYKAHQPLPLPTVFGLDDGVKFAFERIMQREGLYTHDIDFLRGVWNAVSQESKEHH